MLCASCARDLEEEVERAYQITGSYPPNWAVDSAERMMVEECFECSLLTQICEGARP